MPIHFIPLESNSSNDNAPLVWYEQLGVVACDNVLYCVPFIGNEEEKLALIAVDKFSVHHLPVSDLKARWPNDKFFINICYGSYTPSFVMMCQERFTHTFRYVDEINPALRKLQRWMKMVIRRKKQLAVAMALHSRLGEMSRITLLGVDLTESIMRRI